LKQAVRRLNQAECEALVADVLKMSETKAILARSLAIAERCYADLLA
jgi:hypothetical protein